MAMQTTGPIKFSQLQAEFGGSNPISLSEYYRGGAYVVNGSSSTNTIPTSGAIAISKFYGTAAADLTPDAINWPNAVSYGGTYQQGGRANTAARTISGISQPIQLRVLVTALDHTQYGGVDVAYSKNGAPYVYYGTLTYGSIGEMWAGSTQSTSITVANGDTLAFQFTTGGDYIGYGSMYADFNIVNASTNPPTSIDAVTFSADWYGNQEGPIIKQ